MSILARAALQNKWAWVGERIDSSEGEQSTACGRVICSDAQANNKGFLSYKQRRTTRSVLVSMPWQAVGHSVIVATHCTRTASCVEQQNDWNVCAFVLIVREKHRATTEQQKQRYEWDYVRWTGLCVLLLLLESVSAAAVVVRVANVSLLLTYVLPLPL